MTPAHITAKLDEFREARRGISDRLDAIRQRIAVAEQEIETEGVPCLIVNRMRRQLRWQRQQLAKMEVLLEKLGRDMQALGEELAHSNYQLRPPRLRIIRVPVEALIVAALLWLLAAGLLWAFRD